MGTGGGGLVNDGVGLGVAGGGLSISGGLGITGISLGVVGIGSVGGGTGGMVFVVKGDDFREVITSWMVWHSYSGIGSSGSPSVWLCGLSSRGGAEPNICGTIWRSECGSG